MTAKSTKVGFFLGGIFHHQLPAFVSGGCQSGSELLACPETSLRLRFPSPSRGWSSLVSPPCADSTDLESLAWRGTRYTFVRACLLCCDLARALFSKASNKQQHKQGSRRDTMTEQRSTRPRSERRGPSSNVSSLTEL